MFSNGKAHYVIGMLKMCLVRNKILTSHFSPNKQLSQCHLLNNAKCISKKEYFHNNHLNLACYLVCI